MGHTVGPLRVQGSRNHQFMSAVLTTRTVATQVHMYSEMFNMQKNNQENSCWSFKNKSKGNVQ